MLEEVFPARILRPRTVPEDVGKSSDGGIKYLKAAGFEFNHAGNFLRQVHHTRKPYLVFLTGESCPEDLCGDLAKTLVELKNNLKDVVRLGYLDVSNKPVQKQLFHGYDPCAGLTRELTH